jgi:general secretion pathway protein D
VGLLLFGCGSYGLHRQAQVAEDTGNWDDAVLGYIELTMQDPGNITYRSALIRAKIKASQQHFESGKRFHQASSFERALIEYRQAVELDPTNQYAYVELQKVRDEIEARAQQRGAQKTIDEMKREARERSQPPLLNPRSNDPISLDFPQPVPIKDIYRALGKAYGINILFDPNLRSQDIAIELKDVTPQKALEILMRGGQHFYKVLDEHTILIAAESAQNRRAYEDQVIQTFFLSNAEVKDVMTMIRTMVDAKKVAANDQQNAIIMRDSADRVKVAERLIQVNDKARAEVVVDVELLQVNSKEIRDIGLSLSTYSVGWGLDLGEDTLRLSDFEHLNENHWGLTVPSFLYSFVKNNSNSQVLAKPQLRISEGEKASLHIGERVPIPSTTFNTSNTAGGNVVPVTSFQYTDVGIKVDIEPRVHHNLEVTLKLSVEVSNLAGEVEGSSGVSQPIIGTRKIDTTIRLKDGETNFLAGLLRTDEISGNSGIPGLSEIPLLGRLFSKKNTDNQRTDVILTMTPHIIRRSDITEEDLMPVWVGTEANISFSGGSPRVESDAEGPFDEGASSADRVRELINQRVRELPRGLQDAGEARDLERKDEPPSGIDLAPPAFGDPVEPSDDGSQPPQEIDPSEQPSDLSFDFGRPGTSLARPDVSLASAGAITVVPRLAQEFAVLNRQVHIDLRANAPKPVSHLPFAVVYDPTALRFVEWQSGYFMGPTSESQVLVAEQSPGRLMIGASRLSRRLGVVGSGVVATLVFEALESGETELVVEGLEALDQDMESLRPARGRSLSLTVRERDEIQFKPDLDPSGTT